jgi:hypothetical protein
VCQGSAAAGDVRAAMPFQVDIGKAAVHRIIGHGNRKSCGSFAGGPRRPPARCHADPAA